MRILVIQSELVSIVLSVSLVDCYCLDFQIIHTFVLVTDVGLIPLHDQELKGRRKNETWNATTIVSKPQLRFVSAIWKTSERQPCTYY